MCKSVIVIQKHYSSLGLLAIRLEEKFFDMESENKILRQQGLLTPAKWVSDHSPSLASKVLTRAILLFLLTNTVNKLETLFLYFQIVENGHYLNDENHTNVRHDFVVIKLHHLQDSVKL